MPSGWSTPTLSAACWVFPAGWTAASVSYTHLACGDNLNIYSGNDDQIGPLLALGGKGVISVLSNVAPQYTLSLIHI